MTCCHQAVIALTTNYYIAQAIMLALALRYISHLACRAEPFMASKLGATVASPSMIMITCGKIMACNATPAQNVTQLLSV